MTKQNSIDGKNKADEDTIEYRKTVTLKDGVHEGKIVSVVREERGGFDYLDIQIKTQNEEQEELIVSASMPTNLSDFSVLGKILNMANFDMTYGDNIKISTIGEFLTGQEITFQTTTEKTDKGDFYRILNDTIKFK